MTGHRNLLPRYQHLRQVGLQLNNQLVETLPRDVLDEGGKKLGILKNNMLVLDSEDEIAVLMDFCLQDVRRQGKNAIERYLEKTPPPPDSDEMVYLQALRQARYSLFEVEGTEPGVGVGLRDLLRDEAFFVMDVGFSRTAPIGTLMASRVMTPEGMGMSTGASLPLGVLEPAKRGQFLEIFPKIFPGADSSNLSPAEASDLTARIIRTLLEVGAAEQVQYLDPGSGPMPRGRPAASATVPRVGRNKACPCGSGRKYRKCCGARR